jgi:Ni,Fe-hydrogenase III large subunit/Ni,Fe-hydrogenase III component G
MTRVVTLLEWVATAVAVGDQQPWPRVQVDADAWEFAIGHLVSARWALLGLWADGDAVHMALSEEAASSAAVISIALVKSGFPSVGDRHVPAQRLERSIFDLYGWQAHGASDRRPWLDHGRWGVQHPLGAGTRTTRAPAPYAFLPAEGESLHQIPVGPVHAGIIEPGHFRFHAHGETVVRLEERLGYVHKGVEALMAGASVTRGCQLAARVSGDSTVAYAYAFARAAEAALSSAIPPRAVWLRALLAELERVANHLGDIGAICNDASFALMHTHCGILREQVLRASDSAFGVRLLRDIIVPGGLSRDLDPAGESVLRVLVANLRKVLPALISLYDNTASLQDRTVGTGMLRPDLAWQFACGGYVGRASGRTFDARRHLPYPPYDQLAFDVPTLDAGDVDARVWIRIHELGQSLSLLDQLLAAVPAGDIRVDLPLQAGEGIGVIEGFRGDILVWLRLDACGAIARCHLRDPSWFQWPLLEVAIEGNIVADFPLCNKSFNCSYSGHDL